MVETLKNVSSRESLAKAKELQAPLSFATGALGGLTLYRRGNKDAETMEMIREGIRFCNEYCLRDFEAFELGKKFLPGKGPRHYSVVEVVSDPSEIPELKRKVEHVNETLDGILAGQSVPEEKIRECHHLIKELLQPYERLASVAMGEWKYGPTLPRR
jgi:hypothetical protein